MPAPTEDYIDSQLILLAAKAFENIHKIPSWQNQKWIREVGRLRDKGVWRL